LEREEEEAERREKEKAEAERGARKQAETMPGGAETPKVVPKPRSRAKYVILGLVGLAVIVGAIWYFWLAPFLQRRAQIEAERKVTIEKSGPAARAARMNPKDGLKYVRIPPGTFMMGCSPDDDECSYDEKPPHQVTITKGFWLGQTEVTVAAYKRFAKATGRPMPSAPYFNAEWNNDDMPIVNVSWDDAHEYCVWAGGRLPTEAEWEYAARGGSTEARYGDLDRIAWYGRNSRNQAHAVAQKQANGFGLFDMLGNASEYVNDWYKDNYYDDSPSQDPTGPASGQLHTARGRSYSNIPGLLRVSNRDWVVPAYRLQDLGFRCGGEVVSP
jgi:formylglycine-generating enzyme required for sulfatase activity